MKLEDTIARLRRLRALQARAKKLHGKTIEDMAAISAEIAATPERRAHAVWRAIMITDAAGVVVRRGYSRAPVGAPPRGFYEFQPCDDGLLSMGLHHDGDPIVNLEIGERALQVWCQLDTRSLRVQRFHKEFETALRSAAVAGESEGP